eukprot:GHVU01086764.1.p1 GENE.GHVU01086764.1~~GHVU01086764.1.p1  ORF type:complete len:415 (-),score=89.08 GHVU01086764.1:789-2033(-)
MGKRGKVQRTAAAEDEVRRDEDSLPRAVRKQIEKRKGKNATKKPVAKKREGGEKEAAAVQNEVLDALDKMKISTGGVSGEQGRKGKRSKGAAPESAGVDNEESLAGDNTHIADGEEAPDRDPYLLADAHYIKKSVKWINKQRTLVLATRGIVSRHRHLMLDFRRLLPHHKAEVKWEKKGQLRELGELAEIHSCNNVLFFESRKATDLYLWLGRCPAGPTIKFQAFNVHTVEEMKATGNCLLHSRPLLSFDSSFADAPETALMKELFVQAFGTPRNHPKAKPFHDHVMHFAQLDGKIWIRHYQVAPLVPTDTPKRDLEKVHLIEIGPRVVLQPLFILNGAFQGRKLYTNTDYRSPTALRVLAKKTGGSKYAQRVAGIQEREARHDALQLPADPFDAAALFGGAQSEAAEEEDSDE